MQTFTKEQQNILKEFESNFYTAIQAGYIRNVTGSKMDLIESTTGERCSNRTCSHCMLTFFRQIGEKYFKTKDKFQKETEPKDAPKTSMEVIDKIIESNPEVKEQVKEMIKATNTEQDGKQKRGRPKKADTK